MRISRSLTILGSVLIITTGAMWIADAATSPDTITACASKPGNALRFSADGTCKANETKLVWNQQGVRGEDGVSGYEKVTNVKQPGVGFLGEGVSCPPGKVVLGGGAVPIDDNGVTANLNVFNQLDSEIVNDGRTYTATWLMSANSFADNVQVWATCATVTP